MAILIEGFSLVIRNDFLDSYFPGGKSAYCEHVPPAFLCGDEDLLRVAYMTVSDAINRLQYLDNIAHRLGGSTEANVTIVSRSSSMAASFDWLQYAETNDQLFVVWLKGKDIGRTVVPEGWSPNAPIFERVPDALDQEYELIVESRDLQTYRHIKTGTLFYKPKPIDPT